MGELYDPSVTRALNNALENKSTSEAISEGNVGLMQAVERFEPEKSFRFTTYAVWWIKRRLCTAKRSWAGSECRQLARLAAYRPWHK